MSIVPSEGRRNAGAYVSFSEFRQIDIPNLERHGEGEQLDTPLVHLKALLKVLVLFEELRVVNDNLSICDLEFEDFVVGGLGRFNGPQGFFEVNVERPEFNGFKEAGLNGQRL